MGIVLKPSPAAPIRLGKPETVEELKQKWLQGRLNLSQIPEYHIYRTMLRRCENQNDKDYRHYGQRGIRVCQAWRDSFWLFLEDVGRRPSAELSLDRMDNDGNYETGNVRWATAYEQNNNKRKKKLTKEDLLASLAIAAVLGRISKE
jgi:hypothetical protein